MPARKPPTYSPRKGPPQYKGKSHENLDRVSSGAMERQGDGKRSRTKFPRSDQEGTSRGKEDARVQEGPFHVPRGDGHTGCLDDFAFAADPFDLRFRRLAPIADMRWTALGLLVQWYWWMRQRPDPAFTPILDSVRECMRIECPDTLEFLEKHENDIAANTD